MCSAIVHSYCMNLQCLWATALANTRCLPASTWCLGVWSPVPQPTASTLIYCCLSSQSSAKLCLAQHACAVSALIWQAPILYVS
ncbi:hypothetical protein COO60DRAFT_1544649 [Scenedesmus sp. NREL 46B-D3]|nr:hypothetical protein COO60DRAFT_1544649 [Scenedesmus sp. NREL 46B-D3]